MVELNELKRVTKIVKTLLENKPDLRENDDLLYLAVCYLINAEIPGITFHSVLVGRKKLGLPSFETVRRTRQKVQATYPELKGTKRVREGRKAKETEYREYARGSV